MAEKFTIGAISPPSSILFVTYCGNTLVATVILYGVAIIANGCFSMLFEPMPYGDIMIREGVDMDGEYKVISS